MPKTYKNAIILPVVGCENKPLYPNARGGVFTSDRKPIKDAFLRREYRVDVKFNGDKWDRSSGKELKHHHLILPGKISGTDNRLHGEYIFAGYLFPHFGHFLLESLANLWFFKQHPETPIIWLGVHNQSELNTVAEAFIELYDIKNPIHILTKETIVETLIVPEPGYMIHTKYTQDQVKALQAVDCPKPQKGKNVWLSRSGLDKGRILNENKLEAILEENGWIIFQPEKHPLRDQLGMLHDAEMIAGIEGSAFHSLMMLRDFKGQVQIFARRRLIEFDFIFIAETLGINQSNQYPKCAVWSHGKPHWNFDSVYIQLAPILESLKLPKAEAIPEAPSGTLTKITQSLVKHLPLKSIMEFWVKETSIASALPAKCKAISVSDQARFDSRVLRKNHEHVDLKPQVFLSLFAKRPSPSIYCFRHHDNEKELLQAFNSSVIKAPKSTLWLIEYEAKERPVDQAKTPDTELSTPSVNHKLVKFISSFCPNFTIYRIKSTNTAIAWQQPRNGMETDINTLAELDGYSEFDRNPVESLNEIAQQYIEATKGPSAQKPTQSKDGS